MSAIGGFFSSVAEEVEKRSPVTISIAKGLNNLNTNGLYRWACLEPIAEDGNIGPQPATVVPLPGPLFFLSLTNPKSPQNSKGALSLETRPPSQSNFTTLAGKESDKGESANLFDSPPGQSTVSTKKEQAQQLPFASFSCLVCIISLFLPLSKPSHNCILHSPRRYYSFSSGTFLRAVAVTRTPSKDLRAAAGAGGSSCKGHGSF